MKIAHVAIVTPGMCGLYETTRELVAAERALGVDARIYDPKPTKFYPKANQDRGAALCDKAFVEAADIIVDHSGCDGTSDKLETPHILVAHGRPRHSFMSEVNGGAPCYSYRVRLDQSEKYRAVVTFWPEHVGHLEVMFLDTPVYHVPAPCDLKAWSPDGPQTDVFGGKAGAYNVVVTDAWRDDVDVFDAVNACAVAARKLPGLKMHLYGKQGGNRGWDALWYALRRDGCLGHVNGWTKGLQHVYRAADLLVTSHVIYTRSIREAMACGCPVVSGRIADMHDAHAAAELIVDRLTNPIRRESVRAEAERMFDPMNTARAFLAVCHTRLSGAIR